MAADITLNAGSGGAIIATDPTTSSEHHQLIKLVSGAVGTFNIVSSANPLPVTSASSGLVQISGTPAVTSTSVIVTSGTVTLSSVHTVTATAGTNPWSSAPGFNVPVVSVSSGLIQLSSQISVTATAGTNPWSSAPGFNVPVVSVSSGFDQVFQVVAVSTLGIVSTFFQSTGGAASVNVRGSQSNLIGYSYFNSTATIRSIKIYNTSSAPTIGSTSNILVILMAPGSTGGGGANLTLPAPGLLCSAGIGFTMTANVAATDTGALGLNDLTLDLYFV